MTKGGNMNNPIDDQLRCQLRRANFALKTLELITRQGDGVSATHKLARVKLVVREAIEEIEAIKPQGAMFEHSK
jgi:hypothetical protein